MSQKGYYGSILNRSRTRHGYLVGPFRTHEMALAMVDAAKREMDKANPSEAAFSAFGSLVLTTDSVLLMPTGVLNERLGVTLDATGWAQVPAAYRDAYRLRLNARITGPGKGKKFDEEYQWALASDVEKVNGYLFGRRRSSGCSGYLSTPLMQRRYPYINRQEVEF